VVDLIWHRAVVQIQRLYLQRSQVLKRLYVLRCNATE
jgi:hypothetical protein